MKPKSSFTPPAVLIAVVCLAVQGQPPSAQKPKLRATLKGHSKQVVSLAFSPDDKTLASGSQDQTIKLWDVATGKEMATLMGRTEAVRFVVYSPDGKSLASASQDGTIKLWDIPVVRKADK